MRALASAAFLAVAISACHARNVGGTSADSTAIVAAVAQYRQGWLNGDTAMALSVTNRRCQVIRHCCIATINLCLTRRPPLPLVSRRSSLQTL